MLRVLGLMQTISFSYDGIACICCVWFNSFVLLKVSGGYKRGDLTNFPLLHLTTSLTLTTASSRRTPKTSPPASPWERRTSQQRCVRSSATKVSTSASLLTRTAPAKEATVCCWSRTSRRTLTYALQTMSCTVVKPNILLNTKCPQHHRCKILLLCSAASVPLIALSHRRRRPLR